MSNIKDFSIDEMLADRQASVDDIIVCQQALLVGVTNHKDGLPVDERIRVNREIIAAIDDELARKDA